MNIRRHHPNSPRPTTTLSTATYRLILLAVNTGHGSIIVFPLIFRFYYQYYNTFTAIIIIIIRSPLAKKRCKTFCCWLYMIMCLLMFSILCVYCLLLYCYTTDVKIVRVIFVYYLNCIVRSKTLFLLVGWRIDLLYIEFHILQHFHLFKSSCYKK